MYNFSETLDALDQVELREEQAFQCVLATLAEVSETLSRLCESEFDDESDAE